MVPRSRRTAAARRPSRASAGAGAGPAVGRSGLQQIRWSWPTAPRPCCAPAPEPATAIWTRTGTVGRPPYGSSLAVTGPGRDLDSVTGDVGWLLNGAATYLLTRGDPAGGGVIVRTGPRPSPRPARRGPPRHPDLRRQPRRRPARLGHWRRCRRGTSPSRRRASHTGFERPEDYSNSRSALSSVSTSRPTWRGIRTQRTSRYSRPAKLQQSSTSAAMNAGRRSGSSTSPAATT